MLGASHAPQPQPQHAFADTHAVLFEHHERCLALREAVRGAGDLWGAEERRAWARGAYSRAS
jgi:hypothetical protein